MAVFKCKMCGGDLDVQEGITVVECEYCGTKQTVPNADNEKKVNLFNRANRLRIRSEFDKATGVYEGIVAEFPEEAEAYWGLCLCNYGIEYVDDSASGKKIPTCHRTLYDSILKDNNFELACKNADSIARQLYEDEAKEINRLQNEILDIAKKEEPFDIFICYKETAIGSNDRTLDSVKAQEIYDALTTHGYKVFFSRITLEGILGKDYEPYIFNALQSAKIMLTVGTNIDHFNAPWVKNEWSRYLTLMKKDKTKTMIPCYCDIDPYDLPDEFQHLQGQDMKKLGYTQDLVRGIEKLLAPSENAGQTGAGKSANATIDSLLMRVFEDHLVYKNWNKAIEACDTVLNIDAKNGRACLGMLMATLHCSKEEELSECSIDYGTNEYYDKAYRFSDAQTKEKLEKYLESARTNIEEKRRQELYARGKRSFDMGYFVEAQEVFRSLSGYQDADELYRKSVEGCEAQGTEKKYQSAKSALERGDYVTAKNAFNELGDYKDSLQFQAKLDNIAKAIARFRSVFDEYKEAMTDTPNLPEEEALHITEEKLKKAFPKGPHKRSIILNLLCPLGFFLILTCVFVLIFKGLNITYIHQTEGLEKMPPIFQWINDMGLYEGVLVVSPNDALSHNCESLLYLAYVVVAFVNSLFFGSSILNKTQIIRSKHLVMNVLVIIICAPIVISLFFVYMIGGTFLFMSSLNNSSSPWIYLIIGSILLVSGFIKFRWDAGYTILCKKIKEQEKELEQAKDQYKKDMYQKFNDKIDGEFDKCLADYPNLDAKILNSCLAASQSNNSITVYQSNK